MLDRVRDVTAEGDYVEFVAAGTQVTGQYRCAECGYGVTIHSELPVCPMCAGTSWEQASWSPFSRAMELQ
jgi:rubrerythrin